MTVYEVQPSANCENLRKPTLMGWPAFRIGIGMATRKTKTAEFIGGPEDGLLVDPEEIAASTLMLTIGDDDEIPVIFSSGDSCDLEPGDEVEIVFLGVYIRESGPGPQNYQWVPALRS